MNEDKYIGMDVHQASIVCAVHNPAGKCIAHSIIETKVAIWREAETANFIYRCFLNRTRLVAGFRLRQFGRSRFDSGRRGV